MDDNTLIKQFLQGDSESFNELIRRHENWVKGMLTGIIKNRQDAEDIAQDVFVKVYFALSRFRFQSEFKTWLYRIVINKVNNHFRKMKIQSWFGDKLEEDMTPAPEVKESVTNSLFEMTHRLPKMQRNVVLLRVYQDLSFKMVGSILSITENSAKVSFHKAKANLKKYLNERKNN